MEPTQPNDNPADRHLTSPLDDPIKDFLKDVLEERRDEAWRRLFALDDLAEQLGTYDLYAGPASPPARVSRVAREWTCVGLRFDVCPACGEASGGVFVVPSLDGGDSFSPPVRIDGDWTDPPAGPGDWRDLRAVHVDPDSTCTAEAIADALARGDLAEPDPASPEPPEPTRPVPRPASEVAEEYLKTYPASVVAAEFGLPTAPSPDEEETVVESDVEAETPAPERPTLEVADTELHVLADAGLASLVLANEPPSVYARGNALARLIRDATTGRRQLATLDRAGLRDRLSRVARWVRTKADGTAAVVYPPKDVVDNLLAREEYEAFPPIDRVVTVPVFSEDGELDTRPGYHPAARVYYDEPPELRGVRHLASAEVDWSEVQAARTTFLRDLLGEFPFVTEADRANAVALLLEPFVRELIAGPTPLYVLDAPAPGTGKSTLARVALTPALDVVSMRAQPREKEEWRKAITADLQDGAAAVVYDNVAGHLDSSALEQVLTSQVWSDRILGATKVGRFRVRNTWVATLNNASLSTALARRSVRVRLDSGLERPWERSFERPDVEAWARRERPQLVAAALTLVRWWVQEERPDGTEVLASYEPWSRVLGGILEAAGIAGFLGNRQDLWEDADDDSAEWRDFLATWHGRLGDRVLSGAELARHATLDEALRDAVPGVLHGRADELARRLGYHLRERRDRVFGRYLIRRVGRGWRVEEVGTDVHG